MRQASRRTTILGSQLVGLALLAAPAWADMPILDPVPELRPGLLQGFLHGQPPLDSKAFVVAPPESGSPAQQADDADNEALQNLRDTPRWTFAAKDADLNFPNGMELERVTIVIHEHSPKDVHVKSGRTVLRMQGKLDGC